jgi:predicted 2-oxoglutarate/Fe(II)-dependent dioxygenase YbiX
MERKLSDELKTYVFVAKQMIPKKLCSEIVKNNFKIDDSWGIHSWSSYENGKLESSIKKTQEDGLLVKKLVEEEIRSCVMRTIELYSEVYNIPKIINFVTEARINRYIEGTEMKIHHDHIHSLFDGEQKGIPILSVVGVLNDDYEGGDFIFYDNTMVQLGAGDILIFHSNFLYPHKVSKVTKGERWSFVSWGY